MEQWQGAACTKWMMSVRRKKRAVMVRPVVATAHLSAFLGMTMMTR
jgi:hypothetical protein